MAHEHGRRKAEDGKRKTLQIRPANEMVAQLESIALKSGLSVSAVLRLSLQHGLPIVEQKLATLCVDTKKMS
jgi:hypothetical protein